MLTKPGAKGFRALMRPTDVKLISVLRRRWHTGAGLATVHMLPWPYAVAMLVVAAAFLGYRLLADERAAPP